MRLSPDAQLNLFPKQESISTLFSVQPINYGSCLIESMTSYIPALAEAHMVNVGTLMAQIIAPSMGKLPLASSLIRGYTRLYKPTLFNGHCSFTLHLTLTLEALTGVTGLMAMTLLPWSRVFTIKGVFRSQRAWCPICLSDWRDSGTRLYEPLLWSFRAITVCPLHRVSLKFDCPQCGRAAPCISATKRSGFCSYCSAWLGQKIKASPPEALSEFQTRSTENIGRLLELGPKLGSWPLKSAVYNALKDHVESMCDGNGSAFSRAYGIPRATTQHWLARSALPSFDHLLRLAFLSDTSLEQILCDGTFTRYNPTRLHEKLTSEDKPSNIIKRNFNSLKAKRQLRNILKNNKTEPISMTQAANIIGHTKTTLYRHFPCLCREISAKALAYRTKRSNERLRQASLFVETTIDQLCQENIYPSFDRIEDLSPNKALLREREVKELWRTKLISLGLWDPERWGS